MKSRPSDVKKEYAEYLRETARKISDEEEPHQLTEKLKMTANTVETVELGENEFVWVNMEDMTAYHTDKKKVDHFSYDGNFFSMELDCDIEA